MVMILIVLLQSSITDKAVEQVCDLLKKHQRLLESVVTGGKYLEEACSELQSANKYLTLSKSCLSISSLALEHLFRSIQVINKANEYLLASVRKMEMRMPVPDTELQDSEEYYNLRKYNSEVKKVLTKLSDHWMYAQHNPGINIDLPLESDELEHRQINVDIRVKKMRLSLQLMLPLKCN